MSEASDKAWCIEIRCKSKRGEFTSPEEQKLCAQMREKYPEWYSKTERDVFYRTAPFGSR